MAKKPIQRRRADSPGNPTNGSIENGRAKLAFHRWLERKLRQRFDAISKESIPERILRLLRGKRGRE